MPEPICRIICASAGTGKTYRLSLEYIAILLQHYGLAEFNIDNILALTFTRKATAEIRERIMLHLELLLNPDPDDPKARQNLLLNLRHLIPGESTELSITERNRLLSAYREIGWDHTKLQVMTIDAYIGSIFRNIVRPMRTLETFDIDTQAINKRMPFLLNHLMHPDFRERLNNLLSRKVSRSLDDYAKFFSSLIQSRWLYYLITNRLAASDKENTLRVVDIPQLANPQTEINSCLDALEIMLVSLQTLQQSGLGSQPGELLNSDFRSLVADHAGNWSTILERLRQAINSPAFAEKLLSVLVGKNIWSQVKVSKKKYPDENNLLTETQALASRHLANYLMHTLFLPEQHEIIELWGIILKEYDRLIYRYKNMTYDDISWFTFEALFSHEPPVLDPQSEASATEFYQFLSHRTRFLLIDEFQDTSLIQFNILKPIIAELTSGEGSKPFQGLIVVGDEKQSIFGWRGGERDLLLNLPAIFPPLRNTPLDRLKQSWRCPPSLMSFINQVFSAESIHNYLLANGMQWDYELITSERTELETQLQLQFCLQNYSTNNAAELATDEVYEDFVRRMVVPALEEDPTGSIAILCRKGSELAKIQQALDNLEILNLYQPNRFITEHPLVYPLLHWLRYIAWGDPCDLLGFLRSDYIMLNSEQLKQAADIFSRHQEDMQRKQSLKPIDLSSLPLVQKFYDLAQQARNLLPSEICQHLADLCLPHMQPSSRDLLNLHHFINLMGTWETTQAANSRSIPELLVYLEENAEAEDLKQQSITSGEGLQLLTIHKSKGLEFNRVFLFYNLSAGRGNEGRKLAWAVDYQGQDFQHLSDFSLTLHYEKVLKASDYRQLWETDQRRGLLEEMNTLYVAFTRAKSKLHLYFCYRNKDAWPEYFQSREQVNLPLLLCNTCDQFFRNKGTLEHGVWRYEGDFYTPPSKPETKEIAAVSPSPVASYQLPPDFPYQLKPDWSAMAPLDEPLNLNWKKIYLEDKANLRGDLLHYHLSFIIRNTPWEQEYAHRRCLSAYGALLSRDEILDALEQIKVFCHNNAWLFDPHWEIIYTEYELRCAGKTYRIDRLMLSPQTREAMIIDYKSGGIYEPEQLENYRLALLRLPAFSGYEIATRICKIEK